MRRKKFENKGIAPLAFGIIMGIVAAVGGIMAWYVGSGRALTGLVLDFFNLLANVIIPAVNYLFRHILGPIAANLINAFVILNPFSVSTFAPVVWEISKNLAYLILIFLGLVSGYMYIIGKDDDARRILMISIIVAFAINFTFLLAKEVFYVSWVLTKALASYFSPEGCIPDEFCDVGTSIYTTLSFIGTKGMAETLKDAALKQLGLSANPESLGNVQAMITLGSNLATIVLDIVALIILMGFAFIVVGRFLIISFLIGFLPIVIVLAATPWFKGYWDRWWKEFLKWCFNLPLLMLLTLVGFSLIAYGTGDFSEAKEGNLFLSSALNTKVWGLGWAVGDIKDYATAIAISLRFIFICGYYIAIIYLCMRLGDGFGEFGVRAGKRLWQWVGGATLWGARTAWRPAGERIGKRISEASEKLAKYTSTPVIGGLFGSMKRLGEAVGEKMTKPSKEVKEKEAENIIKQYEKEEKLDILLKEVIEGRHKRLEKEITKPLLDKLSAEEITGVFAKIGDAKTFEEFQKNKALFSLVNKKLNGILTAEKARTVASGLTKLDSGKVDWSGLGIMYEALGKGKLYEEAANEAFQVMNANQKKWLGVNETSWRLASKLGWGDDLSYKRGVQMHPLYRAWQEKHDIKSIEDLLEKRGIKDKEERIKIADYISDLFQEPKSS
ncbi:MAG: hypothetical protein ACP5JU_01870 [Minisyncoccia bacterium]